MKIVRSVQIALLAFSFNSFALTNVSWEDTTTSKEQLFIGDSEVLNEDFDAIKVKIVNSTYDHTMSYAPKFLTFDYELERCPVAKNFERELYHKKKDENINVGHLKYWFSTGKCKIFITLKTPYIGIKSIFYK